MYNKQIVKIYYWEIKTQSVLIIYKLIYTN